MSFGLRPYGLSPYGLIQPAAYVPPTPEPTPTAGGLGRKRRRDRTSPAQFGNKDFLGSRRNSRPGVAEEEMREVLAAVKAKAVPIPMDAIEDDDEEGILWLV